MWEICTSLEWEARDALQLPEGATGRDADRLAYDAGTHPARSFVDERHLGRFKRAEEFHALGELVELCSTNRPKLRAPLPLVHVRNALAHGYPLGFEAVLKARKARRSLSV